MTFLLRGFFFAKFHLLQRDWSGYDHFWCFQILLHHFRFPLCARHLILEGLQLRLGLPPRTPAHLYYLPMRCLSYLETLIHCLKPTHLYLIVYKIMFPTCALSVLGFSGTYLQKNRNHKYITITIMSDMIHIHFIFHFFFQITYNVYAIVMKNQFNQNILLLRLSGQTRFSYL